MTKKIIIVLLVFIFCQTGLCMANELLSQRKSDHILMGQSLEELALQLKAQKSQLEQNEKLQKLQIAVAYLSFRSRNLEMKNAELQKKRRIHDSLEDSIAQIKDAPERWELFEKAYLPNPSAQTPKDFSLSEYRVNMLQKRLEEVETEIIRLETEVQVMADDLAKYDDYVKEKLGLLN